MRRFGQLHITWDPTGILNLRPNPMMIENNIQVVTVTLPEKVTMAQFVTLMARASSEMKRALWGRSRSAIKTGVDLVAAPRAHPQGDEPHQHADGAVHSHGSRHVT
jgi:hypothetical protein